MKYNYPVPGAVALKVPADRAVYGFAKIALTDPGFRAYFSPFAFHGRGGIVIGRKAPPQNNAGTAKIAAAGKEYGKIDVGYGVGPKGGTKGVAYVRHQNGWEGYIPARSALIASNPRFSTLEIISFHPVKPYD